MLEKDGFDNFESTPPWIQAVGQHQSSDIWITAASAVGHDMLVQTVPSWLPKLSNQLTYSVQTYPVLIHGMPSNFETSCDSPDVVEFLNDNKDVITHPSSLQHTEFLTHTHDPS